MNPNEKTAFLGRSWASLDKAGLQRLFGWALEDFKPVWKLAPKTQIVVADEVDAATLALVRSQGLEVVSALAWMGVDEVPGCTSVHGYLQGLLDAGYVVREHTTEGNEAPVVARIPVTHREAPRHTSAEHFARYAHDVSEAAFSAAADEIVGWVRATFGDFLESRGLPPSSQSTGPNRMLVPCAESGEGFWASRGGRGISAQRADSVVLDPAITARVNDLGASGYGEKRMTFYADASLDAVRKVQIVAALEGGGRYVSLIALPVVNT